MTITSQALTGDELARFLQLQLEAMINGKGDEFNKELGIVVKDAIAQLDPKEKDAVKQRIAAALKKKFPIETV